MLNQSQTSEYYTNDAPKISVILPVYNAEQFINETVHSILDQTYKDFELIIVNDGSTDMTVEYIENINDKRIVLYHNETNKGIAYTLNKAISIAKGDYIARMDADDICVKTRFEKQINFLTANPDIDVCGTWIKTIGFNHAVRKAIINSDEMKASAIFNYPLFNPSMMFKRSVFINVEYQRNCEPAEDYFLFSEIIDTVSFYNLPEVLLYYRIHVHQSSVTQNKKRLNGANAARRNILKKLNPLFDEQDIKLHLKICENEKVNLLDAEQWLKTLILTNKKEYFFEQKYLESIVFSYWKKVCFNNGDITFTSLKIFIRSELFQMKEISLFSILNYIKLYVVSKYNKHMR